MSKRSSLFRNPANGEQIPDRAAFFGQSGREEEKVFTVSLWVDLGINTLGALIHCKLLEQEQDAGIADNYYKTIATL